MSNGHKKCLTDFSHIGSMSSVNAETWSKIDTLVSEFTQKIAEKNLNHRQAKILLEVLQAEIEECKLTY